MPFRYREAMVEPPEQVERDFEEELKEKEDYELDMYDEVLDAEYIKKLYAKRKVK